MKIKLLILSLLLCLNSFGQNLPITGLCLSNIVAVTGGTCLTQAFTNANPAYFDPTYATAGNYLSEFRNYGPPTLTLHAPAPTQIVNDFVSIPPSVTENGIDYLSIYISSTKSEGTVIPFTLTGTGITTNDISEMYLNGVSVTPSLSGNLIISTSLGTLYPPHSGDVYYFGTTANAIIWIYAKADLITEGTETMRITTTGTTPSYADWIIHDTSTTPIYVPTVSSDSYAVTNLTSATGYGSISSDGGASVTAKGYCWNTSTNPTLANSYTSDGTGTTSFTSTVTGLNGLTTFYARAYATNSVGTAYGANLTVNTAQYTTPYARLLTLTIPANPANLLLTFDTTNPTATDATTIVRVQNVTRSSAWVQSGVNVSYAGEYHVSHSSTLAMGVTNVTGDTFDIQFSIDNGTTWSGNILSLIHI